MKSPATTGQVSSTFSKPPISSTKETCSHKQPIDSVFSQLTNNEDEFDEIEAPYNGEGDELLFMHRVDVDLVAKKLINAHEELLRLNKK